MYVCVCVCVLAVLLKVLPDEFSVKTALLLYGVIQTVKLIKLAPNLALVEKLVLAAEDPLYKMILEEIAPSQASAADKVLARERARAIIAWLRKNRFEWTGPNIRRLAHAYTVAGRVLAEMPWDAMFTDNHAETEVCHLNCPTTALPNLPTCTLNGVHASVLNSLYPRCSPASWLNSLFPHLSVKLVAPPPWHLHARVQVKRRARFMNCVRKPIDVIAQEDIGTTADGVKLPGSYLENAAEKERAKSTGRLRTLHKVQWCTAMCLVIQQAIELVDVHRSIFRVEKVRSVSLLAAWSSLFWFLVFAHCAFHILTHNGNDHTCRQTSEFRTSTLLAQPVTDPVVTHWRQIMLPAPAPPPPPPPPHTHTHNIFCRSKCIGRGFIPLRKCGAFMSLRSGCWLRWRH